jgi:hypothetical protein
LVDAGQYLFGLGEEDFQQLGVDLLAVACESWIVSAEGGGVSGGLRLERGHRRIDLLRRRRHRRPAPTAVV